VDRGLIQATIICVARRSSFYIMVLYKTNNGGQLTNIA
jgi:hypothetical protein